ncbi:MAG TPA: ABC transporter permease [Candidatus Acidoferrum sp.]|nr:ABC transporter permease [Candidatus Acidoferrum sp.]
MGTLWQDVKYGWRMLRRSPGFAVVAVLTLAIGIGANAAIFSVVDTIVLRPLPFVDSGRIVVIFDTNANRKILRGTVSAAEFLDWRDMNHVFKELSAIRPSYVTVTGGGEAEQIWGVYTTGNLFPMLGVKPALGRGFSPEEERPGHEQVVMISYGMWQRRFGGDRGAIGNSILIDYKPYTIIGVLPQNFTLFGTSTPLDIWVPFVFNRAQLNREDHELAVFARLKDNATVPQAQAEMDQINATLMKQYPQANEDHGVHIGQFQQELTRDLRPALALFFGAVVFVLLIACANVANLMLARAATREREIALRSTLGAGRFRILRQLLTESVLLSLIGGTLGILVAYTGIHFMRGMLSTAGIKEVPFSGGISLSGTVLAFTLGLSVLTGILFGLAPSIQISRTELGESLKEGSRGSTGGRRGHFIRSSLIVSEVTLSLLLMVSAGLLIRSFIRLMSEDIGFNPSNLLTMQLWLPDSHYASPPEVASFYQRVLEEVDATPGVKSAGAVNFLPFSRWADFYDFDIAGRAAPAAGEPFTSRYRVIDPQFLRTMDIPIKQGRDFAPSDGPDAAGVALVNEALVRRYWPDESPVGKQIRIHLPAVRSPQQPESRDSWLTIVGVVGDIREWEWGLDKIPSLYLPYLQNPSRLMSIVIRANGNPGQLTSAVRHIVHGVDANQPVTSVHTMDELVAEAVSQRRLTMLLLAVFGGVAMLLAAVGIYGVMAYAVAQRTHEIGIRMALGAEPNDVLRMVVADGMRLAALGLATGLIAAALGMRYLESQLYGVRANDPLTFSCVALVLAGVAAMASYFPARRATKVDPLVALRYE